MSRAKQQPVPERFRVSRATLLLDRVMDAFVRAGGILVMLAVFAIFLFIFLQILPLFQAPEVKSAGRITVTEENVALMGIDEWGELPFFLTEEGRLYFAAIERQGLEDAPKEDKSPRVSLGDRGVFEVETGLPDLEWTAFYYDAYRQQIVLGSAGGRVGLLTIQPEAEYPENAPRRIVPNVSSQMLDAFGQSGKPIEKIALYDSDSERVVGILQHGDDARPAVTLQTYGVSKSLFGEAEFTPDATIDASSVIPDDAIKDFLIGGRGDRLLITTEKGRLYYFKLGGGALERVQTEQPFASDDADIFSMHWLLGKQSAILTSDAGANVTLGSYLDESKGHIVYKRIKQFPKLEGGGATSFSPSLRNRGFLLANDSRVSLRYSTTGKVRWEIEPDFTPRKVQIGPKWNSLFILDATGGLHVYDLEDPHPNAGWQAFFGKIWYEGKPGPEYEWQSSSGSSSFEPKLSIVPLFFGSLKGTVYAMLFALPIAVLAAIYSSQFLRPEAKRYIKPAMEIMASLPSVVLGFLAALWLAPILAERVPSVIMIVTLLPVSAVLLGSFWGKLPGRLRNSIKPGSEWMVIVPVTLLVGYIGWQLGPVLEAVAFRVYDPQVGAEVGNFREWWTQTTGADYEQRNSLVVGIMMGFAVIPIIFTISEDALSNVPPYLKSASLALGASRWQTTWRILLPTAPPGIFSATIIGFGRAVGETMILLMATGNTPIMEWNIFNGMRTLAANIAVELPEAPQYSTLYRTLFLGALVLFLLTFVINTIAEITRQHLREKYRTV